MFFFLTTVSAHSIMMMKCLFASTETVGLLGTGAQDGHLDFHTASSECCFTSTETIRLIMDGEKGGVE